METDVNYPSNDILVRTGMDHARCRVLCEEHPECVGFVVNTNDPSTPCWIKTALANPVAYPGINAFTRPKTASLVASPVEDTPSSPSAPTIFGDLTNAQVAGENVPGIQETPKSQPIRNTQPTDVPPVTVGPMIDTKQTINEPVQQPAVNPTPDFKNDLVDNAVPTVTGQTEQPSIKNETNSTTSANNSPVSHHQSSTQNTTFKSNPYIILAIIGGSAMAVGIILLLSYHLWWKRKNLDKYKKNDVKEELAPQSLTESTKYTSTMVSDLEESQNNSLWQISNPSLQQNCFSETGIEFSVVEMF